MQIYRVTKVNEMDIDELVLFSKLELAKGEVSSALERNEVSLKDSNWWEQAHGSWQLRGPHGEELGQIEAITLD